MVVVLRAQAGRIVQLSLTVRKVRDDSLDGDRQRVNGCKLDIGKPDGTNIASPPTATYVKKGVFLAYWNTAGLPVGDYRVKPRFGVGFNTTTGSAQNVVERDFVVRLVNAL